MKFEYNKFGDGYFYLPDGRYMVLQNSHNNNYILDFFDNRDNVLFHTFFASLNSEGAEKIAIDHLFRCLSINSGGILCDWQIQKLAEVNGMIDPFVPHQVRGDVISYGLSSFGYDMRIAGEFRIFTPNAWNSVVDPKQIAERAMLEYETDDHILIPPNSYALGRSVEHFRMPRNIVGVVLGKSTYARAGLIVNVTPLEPAWTGYVTIEISNATPLPAKVYANEGIAQVIFLQGEEPRTSYADKGGKYQGQPAQVVLSKL